MPFEWRYSFRCPDTLGLKWSDWRERSEGSTLYQLREQAIEEVGRPSDVYNVQSKPAEEVSK